jgi:hypothetical protein
VRVAGTILFVALFTATLEFVTWVSAYPESVGAPPITGESGPPRQRRVMMESPPKLLGIEETEFGSILTLSDGRRVPTDVRPSRLAEAFAEYSSRSLTELLASRSLSVFAGLFHTSQDDWTRISRLVRAALAAEAILRRHPRVWDGFHEPYDVILAKPHRVYGGLDQALYTAHPFQFRQDPNRPAAWRRALLSAPGGWLFEVWVELQTGEVEVTADRLQGHYVE